MDAASNGAGNHAPAPILRARVRVTLDSGIQVLVDTLSPAAMRAFLAQAEAAYPSPDEKQFEIPVRDSVDEDDVLPGSENPAWQRLDELARARRNQFVVDRVLETAVSSDDEDAIVAAHKGPLAALNDAGVELPENRWHAVLRFCLLNQQDINRVVGAAQRLQPLTVEEVLDATAYFRLDTGQSASTRRALSTRPSRTAEAQPG